eukprot:15398807-Alexandrium_andersonii.AAC.1
MLEPRRPLGVARSSRVGRIPSGMAQQRLSAVPCKMASASLHSYVDKLRMDSGPSHTVASIVPIVMLGIVAWEARAPRGPTPDPTCASGAQEMPIRR